MCNFYRKLYDVLDSEPGKAPTLWSDYAIKATELSAP